MRLEEVFSLRDASEATGISSCEETRAVTSTVLSPFRKVCVSLARHVCCYSQESREALYEIPQELLEVTPPSLSS